MQLEGVVHNGVIVPNVPLALPEGTRVVISPAPREVAADAERSIADTFGAASVLRSGDEILAQVRAERDEWGDR